MSPNAQTHHGINALGVGFKSLLKVLSSLAPAPQLFKTHGEIECRRGVPRIELHQLEIAVGVILETLELEQYVAARRMNFRSAFAVPNGAVEFLQGFLQLAFQM